MANHRRDLTGIKKGTITILYPAPNVGEETFWVCICECGKQIIRSTNNLTRQSNTYEICYHDPKRKKLYQVYKNMLQRCFYKPHPQYKDWGGRGITVCPRWLTFNNFFNDVQHLYVEGYDMDRMENDGNYELDNIRWVPHSINSRNSRRAKINQAIADEIRSSNEDVDSLCLRFNITRYTIYRVKNGKSWAA
jgi:hypothetical protein